MVLNYRQFNKLNENKGYIQPPRAKNSSGRLYLDISHDYRYSLDDELEGLYYINGKGPYKYTGEYDTSLIEEISNILGISTGSMENWFYEKFGFDIMRVATFSVSGIYGDINSLQGDAEELD